MIGIKIEEYIKKMFATEDLILSAISDGLEKRGMPQISVPQEVGKLLHLLVKISSTKKILEIGALGGYSTIWMARALPDDGSLLSVEYEEKHALFAQENIKKAGLSDKVRFSIGDATQKLDDLITQGETFDFFFIDADKKGYPTYLEKSISLARSGSLILFDNLFMYGRVFDQQEQSEGIQQIRNTNHQLAEDKRLESIIIPIGDGLGLARVK